MIVAQARFATGIWELASAHKRTVANDPHVPGPGLRRPDAEESRDQRSPEGARRRPRQLRAPLRSWSGEDSVSLSFLVVDILPGIASSASVTGDEITYAAAGPLAKIDQATALAAKREVRVVSLCRLLADRAAEFDGAFAWHSWIAEARGQIVEVRTLPP